MIRKVLYIFLGCLFLVLAIFGIFLPLLPTTPFLLLTAFFFVRSSEKLNSWLLSHPRLGPYIQNFRDNRAIPLHAKIITLTLLWTTFILTSALFLGDKWWAIILYLGICLAVTAHILSFNTMKK